MLQNQLRTTIQEQLISDVPIGAFLSGGIDSSLICALAQEQSKTPVNTFTIGFNEPEFNEAEHARAVAHHLGTNHTEHYFDSSEALDLVESLPDIYSEPFADSSQLPTFLVAKIAKKHVAVALSGDGGDEMFCGYQRYLDYHHILTESTKSSKPLLKTVAGAVLAHDGLLQLPKNLAFKLLSRIYNVPDWWIECKLKNRFAGYICNDPLDVYSHKVSYWSDCTTLTSAEEFPAYPLNEAELRGVEDDPYRQMMLFDICSYLPDDILVKVDRSAMYHSLETRAPFLDHRIMALAATLPTEHMYSPTNGGKQLLKSLLYDYVPEQLVNRPKSGFAVPIAEWLRTDLRSWAESLLYGPELRHQEFINSKRVHCVWENHMSGKVDFSFHLWGVLQLLAWQRHFSASW